ncbi:MAG: response regulator transcription factor [Candidatus Omnitrophica bacterium]|nr:response regulator transcription factor [Candidatus Omnitrophota bacterium]MDE2008669.1 response regulator transcription factor [Candidatus Omnitrophota bacterium]MDE2214810.1 response regulator transcription factor [Candidatus Omnitrophota bacterium]MDE2230887.1 response regulator transcription factor [Candidatus Omnitrophota bacterium]
MSAIRVILADDHAMLRAGLRGLLDKSQDFKVVAEAGNGEVLLEKLKTARTDCVVLDLSMPQMDGLETLKELRQRYPKLKVLILTMQKDIDHFKYAMAHGASGYILKDGAFDQLVMAIKLVMKGKNFVSPAISEYITEQYVRSIEGGDVPSLQILTNREKQVLAMIVKGAANKNIASSLKISIRTVETHRSRLIHKLGIKTAAGLVKYAIAKGLI